MSMHRLFIGRFSISLNLMSLQCDNLSGELQDQWSSSLLVPGQVEFNNISTALTFQINILIFSSIELKSMVVKVLYNFLFDQ